MKQINQSIPASFLALGLVFLVIGFIQQGYQISFESGFFILGLLFVLGGLAAYVLEEIQVTWRSDIEFIALGP
jgi:hypothetical protein